MATRERLKEQRAAMWRQGGFMRGLIVGLVIGLSSGFASQLSTEGLTPQWAYLLVAFGLGSVFGLVIWWLGPGRSTKTQIPQSSAETSA